MPDNKEGPYKVPEEGISPTLYTEFGYRGAQEVAKLSREVWKLKEKVRELEAKVKGRKLSSDQIPECP